MAHPLDQMSARNRRWAIAIFRAIEALGDAPRARDIRAYIWKHYSDQLTADETEHAKRTHLIAWTRQAMVDAGLVSKERRGYWLLTDLGQEVLAELGDTAVDLRAPDDGSANREMEEEDEAEQAPTEVVTATAHAGWEVPVLEALAAGRRTNDEIDAFVEDRYGDQFAPGDRRRNLQRRVLWSYNVAWARTMLKKRGLTTNPSRGQWAITAEGRAALTRAQGDFDLAVYQTRRSTVRLEDPAEAAGPVAAPEPQPLSLEQRWSDLVGTLSPTLGEQLTYALRPDLGASPARLARNLILVGPPGTGKTWLAERIARALTGPDAPGEQAMLVQFHPSYAYEDFVWGIRPTLAAGELRYHEWKGPLLEICEKAGNEQDRVFVLIIDEINRGDPARIFGELLYAVEYRDRAVTLASNSALTVPPNLAIIGTMNSVDRSVALVDYALRRRFRFVRMDPDPQVIAERHANPVAQAAARALSAINAHIVEARDRDHTIGHAWFVGGGRRLESEGDLDAVWATEVRPQLEELFFGEPHLVDELTRRWTTTVADVLADVDDDDA